MTLEARDLPNNHWDVVVIGAGLAGLSLCRHLLMRTDKRVLLLEKRSEIPPKRQKVGESSVQVAGYYFSKVLDMESYLFQSHFMKYNLRFYWQSGGSDGSNFEDYSSAYIRPFSNLPSYQLDRNTFEGELLRRNQESARFTFRDSALDLKVELAEDDQPHQVRFRRDDQTQEISATWVVDTTGRRKLLAKQKQFARPNGIDHGAFFWWVDGLVDIEKLTELDNQQRRLHPNRRHTGHTPQWLATNHFMDEGLWFWVIPLQGKTSLGLVFDRKVVPWRSVFNVEKATQWVCERFPLFARDLPNREVLDFGGLKSFSHDCVQTLSSSRWALAGEAGRFTDPLYSPGSDLISIYNTLIVDAIETDDGSGNSDELRRKCQLYESLMKAVYQAYVPSYATSYDALGDQETFSMKYTWELAIYFGVYVFPFINDLFTDRRFVIGFLRQFSRLGPLNRGVQQLLSGYFQWKKENRLPTEGTRFFDFMEIGTLRQAEKTFYEVGVSVDEAKKILSGQVDNLQELARFIAAHVASVVLDDANVRNHREFVEGIDIDNLDFDPADMAARWSACRSAGQSQPGTYEWSFDDDVLERFRTAARSAARAFEQEIAS